MFKRPSSRRKAQNEGINLNLVPILDTMVTLIAFLLFTMSFLSLVTIESPFPQASTKEVEQALKEKPLQLTLSLREEEAEIWSPFELIPPKKIPNVGPGQPDMRAIHETLVGIKQQYLNEDKIILVPTAGTPYDIIIQVMDVARLLDATDPPVYRKNLTTGIDEQLKTLFSQVIFGNLLGDT